AYPTIGIVTNDGINKVVGGNIFIFRGIAAGHIVDLTQHKRISLIKRRDKLEEQALCPITVMWLKAENNALMRKRFACGTKRRGNGRRMMTVVGVDTCAAMFTQEFKSSPDPLE